MIVKVFKLGEEDILTDFPQGTHIIGRGPALQCNDKRVSRNHATLEVTENDVKITSTHLNPCFLKAANSKTITILSKDSTAQLNDGDSFAFLPDVFWFKIKIESTPDSLAPKLENLNSEQNTKRVIDHSDDETIPDKKTKLEENYINGLDENADIEKSSCETVTNGQNEDELKATVSGEETVKDEVKQENDVEVPEDHALCDSTNVTSNNNDITVKEEINSETPEDKSENNDENSPSTSGTKPKERRERCWYGAQCYRKNPAHRREFTHPGDTDFESDPEDDRPICSFGAACYRKNKDHRKNFKHPPRGPPTKKKRTRKKVDRLNVADDVDFSESDEDDPFIADDDSDIYEGNSDDSDTDWEDSQNVDEDSENIKKLVKEANRFIKK